MRIGIVAERELMKYPIDFFFNIRISLVTHEQFFRHASGNQLIVHILHHGKGFSAALPLGDALAVQSDSPGGGLFKPHQYPAKGRLSSTVFPHDPHDLAAAAGKRDILPKGLPTGIVKGQVGDFQPNGTLDRFDFRMCP